MNTMNKLAQLKQAGEDFEWYPTTDEIINIVGKDIQTEEQRYRYYYSDSGALLDIGAGDGRVLLKVQEIANAKDRHYIDDVYAIEKSVIHLMAMPKSIVVVGTDFMEQSLIDKPVRYIFSNPPYSQYELWTEKILRECNAKFVYLVIPRRWRDCEKIKAALERREAEIESLGELDFEDADRQARAKVEVIRVEFDGENKDAFDSVIEDMLPELEAFKRDNLLGDVPDDDDRSGQVIPAGESVIESLVMAYDAEVADLIETYRTAVKINPKVLKELGVTRSSILKGIRANITGLKNKYWQTLFDRFTDITKRLATKQRQAFLKSLTSKTTIDFTESNIYSILIWVTKWANDYFDQQIIDLFKSLSEKCNVENYKSNQRTWQDSGWRYNTDECKNSHYKLEYRIVVARCGGICTSPYSYDKERYRGLEERAWDLLSDCVTVANNLGFDSNDGPGSWSHTWESNTRNEIGLTDGETLVAVRAFKNGNMHMHFNQRFMLSLNVEAGRLLGWLKSPQEAVDELKVTGDDAEFVNKAFASSFRLTPNNVLKLTDRRESNDDDHHPQREFDFVSELD